MDEEQKKWMRGQAWYGLCVLGCIIIFIGAAIIMTSNYYKDNPIIIERNITIEVEKPCPLCPDLSHYQCPETKCECIATTCEQPELEVQQGPKYQYQASTNLSFGIEPDCKHESLGLVLWMEDGGLCRRDSLDEGSLWWKEPMSCCKRYYSFPKCFEFTGNTYRNSQEINCMA